MAGRTPRDGAGKKRPAKKAPAKGKTAKKAKAGKKAAKKKAAKKKTGKKASKKVGRRATDGPKPSAAPAEVKPAPETSLPEPRPSPYRDPPAESPEASPPSPRPPVPSTPPPAEVAVASDPLDAGAEGAATEDPLDRFFFQPRRTGLEPALAALSAAPEAGWREALEKDGIEAFLTFRMGVEWYAVRISALREIVKPLALTPVPRTPEHVEGVVTLRGEVLPVLDLHLRLGLERPPVARATRLLVLDTEQGPAAFVVEEVGGVWRPPDPLREPPPSSLGARGELIETLLRADDRVLPLLDLEVSLAVEFEERGHRREARGG